MKPLKVEPGERKTNQINRAALTDREVEQSSQSLVTAGRVGHSKVMAKICMEGKVGEPDANAQ